MILSMANLIIPKEKFSKILDDFEVLINDVESTLSQENMIIRGRINDIKLNPSIGKSEEELDNYLRNKFKY